MASLVSYDAGPLTAEPGTEQPKLTPTVNVDESNPLVYDFYGFPANYYKQTFKSRGDPALLGAVKEALTKGGIPNTTDRRGLDHGVWGESTCVAGDRPLVSVHDAPSGQSRQRATLSYPYHVGGS